MSSSVEEIERGVEAIASERWRLKNAQAKLHEQLQIALSDVAFMTEERNRLCVTIADRDSDIERLKSELYAEKQLRDRASKREESFRLQLDDTVNSVSAKTRNLHRELQNKDDEIGKAKEDTNIALNTVQSLEKSLRLAEVREQELQIQLDSSKRKMMVQEATFQRQIEELKDQMKSFQVYAESKSKLAVSLSQQLEGTRLSERQLKDELARCKGSSVTELSLIAQLEKTTDALAQTKVEAGNNASEVAKLKTALEESESWGRKRVQELESAAEELQETVLRLEDEISKARKAVGGDRRRLDVIVKDLVKQISAAETTRRAEADENDETEGSGEANAVTKSPSKKYVATSIAATESAHQIELEGELSDFKNRSVELEKLANDRSMEAWEWAEVARARDGEVDALTSLLEKERRRKVDDILAIKLKLQQTEMAHIQARELLRDAEAKLEIERGEYKERETWLEHQLEEMAVQVQLRTTIAFDLKNELENIDYSEQERLSSECHTLRIKIEELTEKGKPKPCASVFVEANIIPPKKPTLDAATATEVIGPVTSDVDLGDKDQKRSTLKKAIVEFRHRNRPADLPEEMQDVILRQGWLFKNKAKRSKWQRRWFVLAHPATLRYFRHQDDKQPAGFLVLSQCEIKFKDINPPEGNYGRGILLIPNKQSDQDKKVQKYRLASKTGDDMNAWIEAIQSSVKSENRLSRSPSPVAAGMRSAK